MIGSWPQKDLPNIKKMVSFYNLNDNKVFVSTNATFWEKDCMKNKKPKSEAIIEEIIGKMSTPSAPIVITAVVDKILS